MIPWYLYLPLSKATSFIPFSIERLAISFPIISANSFLVFFSVRIDFSKDDALAKVTPFCFYFFYFEKTFQEWIHKQELCLARH